MDFLIREMTKDDVDSVFELESLVFSSPYSKPSLESVVSSERSFAFVAEYENQLIGYIEMEDFIDTFSLNRIETKKEFRQNGVANQLLKKVLTLDVIKLRGNITLEVRKSNTEAIDFYKSNGFENIGTRKNYYSNPKEDAEIYKLTITD